MFVRHSYKPNFRLIGTEGTFRIYAHSSLDAGARWKSDPNFYSIGELEFIEVIEKNDTRGKRYDYRKGHSEYRVPSKPRQARAPREAKAARVAFDF